MDTENFLLKRRAFVERLEMRRSRDLTRFPFQMGGVLGLKFPSWLKWGLSLACRGGMVSQLLQVGLTVAAPLLLKRKVPFLGRLLSIFQSSEA